MNITKTITVGVVVMTMGVFALDNVEVTNVTARQRYPWNGKVDIDFTLDSKATEPYQMQVEVYDNVGKTNLPVKSVCTENVSVEANPCMVRTDTTRIVWDAAKDLPNGFKCTNVLVTCRDARTVDDSRRYMIIDVSGGSTASNYPITYTNRPPEGGWTEEDKIKKIVLRKIDPGSFYMGSLLSDVEHSDNEVYHRVEIGKSYYIAVFELTAGQYANIMGGASGDTKPVEKSWREIRGCDVAQTATCAGYTWTQNKTALYSWPTDNSVDVSSLMGVLRSKTKKNFDLPTEAQWEMACKAGSLTPLYLGCTNSMSEAGKVRGEPVLDPTGSKLIYVGNYLPNSFGLYDMTGNVAEWCLDVYCDDLGTSTSIDPSGPEESFEDVTLLNNKFIDMYDLSAKGTIECGGAIANFNACYYNITYIGCGIRRVVKGNTVRAAERSSALNVCYTNPMFKMSITEGSLSGQTRYESVDEYDNERHGIRLTLAADE